jgi:hypothetical protein
MWPFVGKKKDRDPTDPADDHRGDYCDDVAVEASRD